jgi:1,4-dihydroxy-2-naphthoate octaprenyltransferase
VTSILRRTRPLHILLASLTYILGLGVANYLAIELRLGAAWLGIAWLVPVQLASALLLDVFRPSHEPIQDEETPRTRLALRARLLGTAAVLLASAAIVMLLMFRADILSFPAVFFQILSVGLGLAYSVPPLRLVYTGFGELVLAVLLVSLPASLAFSLQAGQYHRLVGFITLPLVLLLLGGLLAADFPSFAADQKYQRRTMLVRIGWERAVPLMHLAILSGYGLLAAAPLFGIALRLVWPGFLTIPFALLQLLLIRNVSLGGRPNWALLNASSIAVVALSIYLLTLSFWIR